MTESDRLALPALQRAENAHTQSTLKSARAIDAADFGSSGSPDEGQRTLNMAYDLDLMQYLTCRGPVVSLRPMPRLIMLIWHPGWLFSLTRDREYTDTHYGRTPRPIIAVRSIGTR